MGKKLLIEEKIFTFIFFRREFFKEMKIFNEIGFKKPKKKLKKWEILKDVDFFPFNR